MEHILWRVDEVKNLTTKNSRKQCDDDCQYNGNTDGIAYVASHLVIIARSESLCYRDGEACARTITEPHDKEHNAA